MAHKRIRKRQPGWEWRVFFGRDNDGHTDGRGTADEIRGGWAKSKQAAENKAMECIRNHDNH